MPDVNVKKRGYVSNCTYFNNSLNITIIYISELTIEVLKEIVEKLPDV